MENETTELLPRVFQTWIF